MSGQIELAWRVWRKQHAEWLAYCEQVEPTYSKTILEQASLQDLETIKKNWTRVTLPGAVPWNLSDMQLAENGVAEIERYLINALLDQRQKGNRNGRMGCLPCFQDNLSRGIKTVGISAGS